MYREARFLTNPLLDPLSPTALSDDSPSIVLAVRSLAMRAERLNLSDIEIDSGHTFQNRFLLVWHSRKACFSDITYRAFWQEFARQMCGDGPCVDDTLHVIPRESTTADFCVIGGDGRLVSHCANGLMYAAMRFAERHESSTVRFQCGGQLCTVGVHNDSAQVNLGPPHFLPSLARLPAALHRSPVVVNTGEPHAVSLGEDVAETYQGRHAGFCEVGNSVCRASGPAGINWNLVTPIAEGLRIRTFERGVRRQTNSCGTGSAAAFCAARLSGRYRCDELAVFSPGGRHVVSRHKHDILVTGSPTHQASSVLGEFLSAAS